jgi:hypothetical protein
MKVKLDVGERMVVISILPKEGNFLTLRVLRTLVSRIGLTAEEIKEFEVVQEGDRIVWNQKGYELLEFDLADVELDIIKQELKKLDSENKLTQDMFSIYEKFIIS